MVKNIGIKGVEAPEKECNDAKCPFHGSLKIHGRLFEGFVKSSKMMNSAVIEWPRTIKVRKYKRYMLKKSRVVAHNPKCINADQGDKVLLSECRPLSKTKKFVIIKVVETNESSKQ